MTRLSLSRALCTAGLAAILSAAAAPAASAAPTGQLLKMLVDGTQSGLGQTPVISAGHKYFTADDGVHGLEPWVMTPSGPEPLGDFFEGSGSGAEYGIDFMEVGDKTYFFAKVDDEESKLWVTEGSAATTQAVPGDFSNARNFVGFNGQVYFSAGDYSTLHKIDESGDVVEVPVADSSPFMYVEDLQVVGDRLLAHIYDFAASNNQRSLQSTTTGDDWQRVRRSDLSQLTLEFGSTATSGSAFFFNAIVNGSIRPFVTDGTDAGTHEITIDGESIGSVSNYTATTEGKAVFRNSGLWYEANASDGVAHAVGTAPDSPSQVAFVGGKLYYSSQASGMQTPFVPQPASTFVNALSGPDSAGVELTGSPGSSFVESGGVVYFRTGTASVSFLGYGNSSLPSPFVSAAIFRTDGTPEGTVRVTKDDEFATKTDAIGPLTPRPGGGIDFAANTTALGTELWTSTGGAGAGATLVRDIQTTRKDGQLDYDPKTRVSFGDQALFAVSEDNQDVPWVSDGTTAGTHPLDESRTFDNFSNATAFGDRALFTASSGEGGSVLWITDGTASGTRQVSASEGVGSAVNPPQVIGDAIYYVAKSVDDGDNVRYGVYRSTGDGPSTLVDLPSDAPTVANVRDVKAVGTKLFMAIDDSSAGGWQSYVGLWSLDTTTGESTHVTDASSYFHLSEAVAAGDKLFVGARSNASESQVWVSDGTQAGTRDTEASPGSTNQNAGSPKLTASGDAVVATIPFGSSYNRRVFLFQGGDVTPVELSDSVTSDQFYAPAGLNGTFFVIDASGHQLVKLGANGQTSVVREFASVGAPTAIDGKLYFGAQDQEHGSELWTSDGTTDGTTLLSDVVPGEGSSSPSFPFRAGSHIAFMGYSSQTGSQLFGYGEPQVVPTPTPSPTPAATPEPTATPAPTPAPTASPAPTAAPVAATPAPTAISAAATPAPTPKPDPRVEPAAVKADKPAVVEGRKSYVVDIGGSLLGAKGRQTRAECRGQVEILITATVRKKVKGRFKTVVTTLDEVKTKLRWADGKCGYDRTFVIAKRKVPAGAKVEATVTFVGSSTQKPKTGEPITIVLD